MRIWILFGLAAVTALGGPTWADDVLFGPPSLGPVKRAKLVSSSLEARGPRHSEAADETLPAPPVPVVEDTVPRRLPPAPGPPATELKRPAPIAKGPASLPATDQAPARLPDPAYSAGAGLLPAVPPTDPGYAIVDDRPPQRSCPLPGRVCDPGDECGGDCLAWGEACLSALPCQRSKPFRLFDLPELHFHRIRMGGWLEQGVTVNAARPANRFNGPVTFNDREAEYQANQLYLFAERVADPGGFGFDVGGRVDVLYGTDYRFTVSSGLEDEWNSEYRFYGLSVPQAYMDVAWNDLTVRVGHFYTIIGYETVTAPDNFFYSHTYSMQYGEPFTHTGVLGIYDLGDCWTLCGGFHRGWNRWEDNNDDLGLLGGLSWTSPDENASVALALTASNEDDAGENSRFLYSLVCQLQLTGRLKYVLHHDLGYEDDGDDLGPVVQDANWYGFVNYLLYEINPCWSVGVRHEWFSDDDGTRVTHRNSTGGPPKGMFFDGIAHHYQALTAGLNWRPNANVLLRTECRWDWTDPLVPVTDGHFNDYQERRQFLWGTDLIVTF